jgi:hypothetical protein
MKKEEFRAWVVTGENGIKPITSSGYISRLNILEKTLNIDLGKLTIIKLNEIVTNHITESNFPSRSVHQISDIKCALRKYIEFHQSINQ